MPETYLNILEYLARERNFDYTAYCPEMAGRKIKNRISILNASGTEHYYEILTNTPGEPDKLIDSFLINVSHFFRDPLCFEILSKKIIPELASEKKTTTSCILRAWSAGCSHGEEAYSLAILLNEFILKNKFISEIKIFATDIDRDALKKAEAGEFDPDSLNEVKFEILNKYFTRIEETYSVIPGIKSMVRFSYHDLLGKTGYAPTESIFGNFDLILCRNVLIYFNQPAQEKIFGNLYRSLAPKGVLVLGETETIPQAFRDKFSQISNYSKIFKKNNLYI